MGYVLSHRKCCRSVPQPRPLRRATVAHPALQAQRASPAARRGAVLDARVLRAAGPLSPARHDRLPGATLLEEDRIMLCADRSLVSRVREVGRHGLTAGPACYSRLWVR